VHIAIIPAAQEVELEDCTLRLALGKSTRPYPKNKGLGRWLKWKSTCLVSAMP
jgi:hypothetical protein